MTYSRIAHDLGNLFAALYKRTTEMLHCLVCGSHISEVAVGHWASDRCEKDDDRWYPHMWRKADGSAGRWNDND